MKKIFVLAGIILFISFLALNWLFFGNFFDFAKLLGKEASKIESSEKSRFIGLWKVNNSDGNDCFIENNQNINFKTDGICLFGDTSCFWDLADSGLIIRFDDTSDIVFSYLFLNGDYKMTISNISSCSYTYLEVFSPVEFLLLIPKLFSNKSVLSCFGILLY